MRYPAGWRDYLRRKHGEPPYDPDDFYLRVDKNVYGSGNVSPRIFLRAARTSAGDLASGNKRPLPLGVVWRTKGCAAEVLLNGVSAPSEVGDLYWVVHCRPPGGCASPEQRLGTAPVRRNGRERPESRAPEHSFLPEHARGVRRSMSDSISAAAACPVYIPLQFDTSNERDLPCAVNCPIVGSNARARRRRRHRRRRRRWRRRRRCCYYSR